VEAAGQALGREAAVSELALEEAAPESAMRLEGRAAAELESPPSSRRNLRESQQ